MIIARVPQSWQTVLRFGLKRVAPAVLNDGALWQRQHPAPGGDCVIGPGRAGLGNPACLFSTSWPVTAKLLVSQPLCAGVDVPMLRAALQPTRLPAAALVLFSGPETGITPTNNCRFLVAGEGAEML